MALFTAEYRELRARLAQGVGDDTVAYGPLQEKINEEIVRCLWFGLHFDLDQLRTVDGRRLEPLSPGWWSVEPGPDFRRAEILMEESGRVIGDVEIHIRASDWVHHGHAQNPAYDNVVLHVVLWNDLAEAEVHTHEGRGVPQLALFDYVKDDMPELLEALTPSGEEAQAGPTGRYCTEHRDRLDIEWLHFLLGIAGDERVLAKADRLGKLFERTDREQVLYEAVMDALGYKNNRLAFQQLARLVPVKLLREVLPVNADLAERTLSLQAVLYGAAGLLPGPDERAELDEASSTECERVLGRWQALSPALTDEPMGPEHWRFGGTRPWNYPTRRIAGVARLYAALAGGGLFQELLRAVQSFLTDPDEKARRLRTLLKTLTGTFSELEDPYWSTRCRFSGAPLSRPVRLVGPERAQVIVVNVVVPVLLAHARAVGDAGLEGRVHDLYNAIAAPAPNAITRRVSSLLFASPDVEKACVSSARHQQGLHQLYADFCGRDDAGCESCIIRLQLLAEQAGARKGRRS